jgi:hypothetical protein
MIKQSVMDIVASGGEVTWKKLYLCDLTTQGVRSGTGRGTKKKYQLETRYGDYETIYNCSQLYADLETAADRFMLIYNMVESGELK